VEHLIEPGHSAVLIRAAKVTEDKFGTSSTHCPCGEVVRALTLVK
jgi:hypothetical protein